MHTLFIVWDEEYNLGIPIIDEQHRAIVSTINTYHYFVTNKMEGIALKPTLTTLDQYSKLHFATEEEIFSQTEYPDTLKHKELHGNLIRNMIDIEAEVAQDKGNRLLNPSHHLPEVQLSVAEVLRQ